MRIYAVAGGQIRDIMRLYLAGAETRTGLLSKEAFSRGPYVLESFLSVNDFTEQFIPIYKDYMLDSGAFSFIQGNAKKQNLEEYIESYIAFIQKHKIEKFFELDIDSVIGYAKVKEIRKYLEQKCGRPPIPVWHKSRGIADFKKMCENYSYVSIGGYVSKEFTSKEIDAFSKLINYAHKCGAKIHGLGFTALNKLPICHFDSVDSTAWLSGNRFGTVYRFNGKTMIKVKTPEGRRFKNENIAVHNFLEWVKFQKYAETHL